MSLFYPETLFVCFCHLFAAYAGGWLRVCASIVSKLTGKDHIYPIKL